MKVKIGSLRADLSKILQTVLKGEEIIITDHNEPKYQIIALNNRFKLPLEINYEKFIHEFKPILQRKDAQSISAMIREERDAGE